MTAILNRIVTRGFGVSRGVACRVGPVTQGYGGPPKFVIVALRRGTKIGQSGAKRRLRELRNVIVWAKLIEHNNKVPHNKIEGFVNVPVSDNYVRVVIEHLSSRIKKIWEDLKVTIKRLR